MSLLLGPGELQRAKEALADLHRGPIEEEALEALLLAFLKESIISASERWTSDLLPALLKAYPKSFSPLSQAFHAQAEALLGAAEALGPEAGRSAVNYLSLVYVQFMDYRGLALMARAYLGLIAGQGRESLEGRLKDDILAYGLLAEDLEARGIAPGTPFLEIETREEDRRNEEALALLHELLIQKEKHN